MVQGTSCRVNTAGRDGQITEDIIRQGIQDEGFGGEIIADLDGVGHRPASQRQCCRISRFEHGDVGQRIIGDGGRIGVGVSVALRIQAGCGDCVGMCAAIRVCAEGDIEGA